MTNLPDIGAIERLNDDCFCFSLDAEALAHALDAELGAAGLAALVRERCPSIFAARPVFVSALQLQRIAQVVRAVESVVATFLYADAVGLPTVRRCWCMARAAASALRQWSSDARMVYA